VLSFLNTLRSFAPATSEVTTPKEIALLSIIFMVKFHEYNILKCRTLFAYLFLFSLSYISNFLSSVAIYLFIFCFLARLKISEKRISNSSA
jgi:hypothetical protein